MLKLMFLSAAVSMLFVVPGSIFSVHYELPLFRFFKFFGIYIPLAAIISTSFVFDWTVVLSMGFIMLLYVSSQITWIQEAVIMWSVHLFELHKINMMDTFLIFTNGNMK